VVTAAGFLETDDDPVEQVFDRLVGHRRKHVGCRRVESTAPFRRLGRRIGKLLTLEFGGFDRFRQRHEAHRVEVDQQSAVGAEMRQQSNRHLVHRAMVLPHGAPRPRERPLSVADLEFLMKLGFGCQLFGGRCSDGA
jgi:hypothetical protein